MKEQIQELANKAKSSVPAGLGVSEWIEVYNEKLGMLIVQECISIVEDMLPGYQDYRDQIEDAFRRDCITAMKNKFGIEE